MTTDPIAFLESTLPALFAKGVTALRAKADSGDARAKAQLDDTVSVVGAGVIVLDGAGTIYLAAKDGVITPSREKPADMPIRIAVGCEADALEVALGEAARENALDDPRIAEHAPGLASKRLE